MSGQYQTRSPRRHVWYEISFETNDAIHTVGFEATSDEEARVIAAGYMKWLGGQHNTYIVEELHIA